MKNHHFSWKNPTEKSGKIPWSLGCRTQPGDQGDLVAGGLKVLWSDFLNVYHHKNQWVWEKIWKYMGRSLDMSGTS